MTDIQTLHFLHNINRHVSHHTQTQPTLLFSVCFMCFCMVVMVREIKGQSTDRLSTFPPVSPSLRLMWHKQEPFRWVSLCYRERMDQACPKKRSPRPPRKVQIEDINRIKIMTHSSYSEYTDFYLLFFCTMKLQRTVRLVHHIYGKYMQGIIFCKLSRHKKN